MHPPTQPPTHPPTPHYAAPPRPVGLHPGRPLITHLLVCGFRRLRALQLPVSWTAACGGARSVHAQCEGVDGWVVVG